MDTNNNIEFERKVDSSFNSGYGIERGDRDSWKVMVENLYSDMIRLYERERQLIRTEVKEKIDDAKKAVGSMVVGGSMLFVGAFAAVATAIIVLDQFMPLWASALLVTAVLFIVGGIMVAAAKKKLDADQLTPRQSLDTLGEIKTTIKERINEYKSIQHH